jgi:mono/diheme cytochrome c family protein
MRGLNRFALLALAVPALLAITTVSTLADSSPSPSGSPALPGDPAKGETLYASSGCGGCHGAALTGGVGPALNPIEKIPGVPNTLDANFLIDIITNGRKHQPGDPRQTDMPAKGGTLTLTDQDIKDLAAFIINSNLTGEPPLPAGELAKRTILWVLIGVGAMSFITYLLAQYNMRWIARRAAARNK